MGCSTLLLGRQCIGIEKLTTADITIHGAGVFGLSIGYVCARRGAKVRVIDPYGVGAGASGGIVGALAPHTPENWNPKKAFQFESLTMAADFWGDVENTADLRTGYGQTGRLQPIADDRAMGLANRRAVTGDDLWQGLAKWEIIKATGSDWEPATQSGYLIHDTLSARIHPMNTCMALAKAINKLGGEVTIESHPDQGQIVWANGYQGLLDLSDRFAKRVGNGVKGQAALFKFSALGLPQLFADALHIVPHSDGTVAVGSTSEREFDEPTKPDGLLDDVVARARAAFPVLADLTVIQRWAGVRPRAKSRAPMLGLYPERTGHFIANGGFKIGFGMAPKIAHVMADLILDGRDEIPEGFRVEDSF